jgi:hypothetical protein
MRTELQNGWRTLGQKILRDRYNLIQSGVRLDHPVLNHLLTAVINLDAASCSWEYVSNANATMPLNNIFVATKIGNNQNIC